MTNAISVGQSTPATGLGEWDLTVTTAGIYTINVQSFVPYLASGTTMFSDGYTGPNQTGTYILPESQLQIVIKQNSTTLVTTGGSSVSPTQQIVSARAQASCSANDVLKVILTSTATADNQLNAVKSIINVFAGQGQ